MLPGRAPETIGKPAWCLVACGLPPNQQPAPSARQHPREAPLPSPLLPDVVPRSASSFSSESGPRVVNPGSYFAPVTKIIRRSQHQANSPYLVAWSPSFPPWHQERHQHQELPCWWLVVAPAASSHLSAIASSFFPPGSWLAVPVPAASSH